MTDEDTRELAAKEICEAWVEAGMGDECFWEGWPECPTPYNSLTPNKVLGAMEDELEGVLHSMYLADQMSKKEPKK